MKTKLTALAFFLSTAVTQALQSYEPVIGDILFQSLEENEVITMIEGATGSPFSHCGIVVRSGERWLVLEAIGPVRETPLRSWISQGRGDEFAAYRLKPEHRKHIEGMIAAARGMIGRPYDIQYDFDDTRIYCSELIFKAYRQTSSESLGLTCRLADLNWRPYARTIRAITGGTIPIAREMITPRDLARARQLELIRPIQNTRAKKRR